MVIQSYRLVLFKNLGNSNNKKIQMLIYSKIHVRFTKIYISGLRLFDTTVALDT